MLLGWIAGTMAHSDPAVVDWLPQTKVWNYGLGIVGALGVLLMGVVLKKRAQTTV
jgi:hypothetical protein